MNQIQNFFKKINNLTNKSNNSMDLARDFFKYGNRGRHVPNWLETEITDKDLFTGYSYAGIMLRAETLANLVKESAYTKSLKDGDGTVHPYFDLIDNSPTFTNDDFWSQISLYLDLEGIYYLMALRESENAPIQEFKLLNPYNISRIYSKDGEFGGYLERRDSKERKIPKHMIIEIKAINPFDNMKNFAKTDAAKDSQYNLKSSGDYTKSALKNNINASSIITTDVILDDKSFANFVSAIKSRNKGEPLFGNGAGSITYKDTQVDLDKAALPDVNNVNREELFAVYGLSKTIMGIEQSGTTRETSRVQKELFIENHVIPQFNKISGALNQDFKNNYKNTYISLGKPEMAIRNPLARDRDAEIKDNQLKDNRYEFYKKLRLDGYSHEDAVAFVEGKTNLSSLPEIELVKELPPIESKEEVGQENTIEDQDIVKNQANQLIMAQQASLQNAIVNIEAELVSNAIERIKKRIQKNSAIITNEFTDILDIISKLQKRGATDELVAVLTNFYGIVFAFDGPARMQRRVNEYQAKGNFVLGKKAKNDIEKLARKVAESHVDTVLNDLLVTAREGALQGLSQEQLIDKITTKFSKQISQNRAKAVARTETNRAFTRSQYEADRQFIEQNNLEGRVYKKWVTRSDDPCAYCQKLSSEGWIPFDKPFRNLGDTVSTDSGTLPVSFESLDAGNAHTNCSCSYEIKIEETKADNSSEDLEKELIEIEKLL